MNDATQFFDTTAAAGGYEIERSLRFNSSDSAYLSKNFGSAGNRKTWTWAGWVKRSGLGAYQNIFGAEQDSNNRVRIEFSNTDTLIVGARTGGSNTIVITTSQVFRDPSSWYHLVFAIDTTQASSSDRVKIYVNGLLVTALSTTTYPTLNHDTFVNATVAHAIGAYGIPATYFNGYLADIHFIDGQALDPTSFGEFDTNGVWQPIAYAGTYGTNGFHLPFSDNSTAAALGTDTSGNGNNWTVNNIAVGSNPVFSSFLTTNGSTTGWFGGTPAQAFDSSTTTFVQGALGGDVTFTPSIPIPVGTLLRIWADSGSGSGVGSSGYQIIYNGTTIYNQSAMWTSPYTISAAAGTSLSSLVIDTSAGGEAMRLFAVEVDGVILVDGAGAGNDSLVDSPTNYGTDTGAGGEVRGNYATLNPLFSDLYGSAPTISNGNLDLTQSSERTTFGTIAVSSGKWYWEITIASGTNQLFGITDTSKIIVGNPTFDRAGSYYYYPSLSRKYVNGSYSSYGSTVSVGDIVGAALDLDAGTITFYKNGTSLGVMASSLPAATYVPGFGAGNTNAVTHNLNFGQRSFAYTAPSGFKALCTTNLAEPTIADGSTVMDVKLYTGNGTSQTISGLGFSPDLVWIKRRDVAQDNNLYDSVRGSSGGYIKQLLSNATSAESPYGDGVYGGVTALNSDGFSLDSSNSDYRLTNASSSPYVAWTWDAGSSTVSNTDGSITSQVRANASAGFSIVTYTGNGSNATIGHGLNAAPEMLIIKRRNDIDAWPVYHTSLGNTQKIYLNLTNAALSGDWQNTSPTSTVWSTGSGAQTNGNGSTYVCYAFAPVSGYSAMGKWSGGSDAFVYLGFRPKWLLIKANTAGYDWLLFDSTRSSYNLVDDWLSPNLSAAETQNNTVNNLDFLSNGFKIKGTGGYLGTAVDMFYIAFAEHPFAYARAR